jgi:uncharacterized lipoprotein NlpE involved in copper resistance
MKSVAKVLIVAASLTSMGLVGCASKTQENVTSTYRTQYTSVAVGTAAATDAAKAVLEAEGLKDVVANSTNADGKATAKKADGTVITVDVEKDTDTTSKLKVNVGMLGDPKYGAELAAKIRAKAEGK